MGKDSPSPPPAPDYAGAAAAQGAANVETARVQGQMSNPNIYGPLGSQTVTWSGDQPTVTQNLTPDALATLRSQQQVQRELASLGVQGIGTARNVLGTAFSPNLPGLQTALGSAGAIAPTPTLSSYGQAAGGVSGTPAAGQLDLSRVAAMPVSAGTTAQQAIMSRLAPQIAQSDAALRQRLANQGLVPGGEAYQNAMTTQGQQANDLMTQAALQGINLDIAANQQGFGQALQAGQFGNQAAAQNFQQAQAQQAAQNAAIQQNQQAALQQQQAGMSAQNQLYNQMLQGAQFGNMAQQQSLQQQLALRNQPLNEIVGLMGGSQIQMPQFQGYQGSNIAPPPIFNAAQAQGQAAMDAYGIQSANANAANSGLFNLLGSGVMAGASYFSDRRLKSNIERVGTHEAGVGIYEYDIFGERQRGVMADEVEQVMPQAVITHASGYKMVDYGMLA